MIQSARYRARGVPFPNLLKVESLTNKLYTFYTESDQRIASLREHLEQQRKKEFMVHYVFPIRWVDSHYQVKQFQTDRICCLNLKKSLYIFFTFSVVLLNKALNCMAAYLEISFKTWTSWRWTPWPCEKFQMPFFERNLKFLPWGHSYRSRISPFFSFLEYLNKYSH